MNMKYLLLLTALCFTGWLPAQSDLSWKKLEKLADENAARGEYANAAEQYQQAWLKKPSNASLIYRAGKAYATIKDYQNAAAAFEKVQEETDLDPLMGLLYGRALRQSGRYDEAARVLSTALTNYKGPNAEVVGAQFQADIRGAELGVQFEKLGPDPAVQVSHLGSNVNTIETEFGPLAFSDEVLYFSSTAGSRAEIYRSTKQNGQWGPAVSPSLPEIEADHYCNGTLTPDNKRFYFTICTDDESWGGLSTRCEIYLTRRENNAWTNPERLRDYINMEEATTTHPYVVHDGEAEILYFASNREGGKGGMDIWYTTRAIAGDDIDFTFPINAGSKINSPGDEITPYYDSNKGQLYFAANGLVGLGGYDIFRAEGRKSGWKPAENVGLPLNSPADDYFYTQSPSGRTGFLVSNRSFGMEKITTVDEDIFELSFGAVADQFASGKIYSKNDGTPVRDVAVAVYELGETGARKLIDSRQVDNGTYRFKLRPDRRYVLEAQKAGFRTTAIDIDLTQRMTTNALNQSIFMDLDDQTVAENTAQQRSDTQAAEAEAEAARLAEVEAQRIAAEQAEAKRLAEQEAQRLADEKAEAAAEADRLAEAQRLADEQVEADRKADAAAETRRLAELEAQRLADERAAADLRKAEESKQAERDAALRLADERAAAQRVAEAERRAREAEQRAVEQAAVENTTPVVADAAVPTSYDTPAPAPFTAPADVAPPAPVSEPTFELEDDAPAPAAFSSNNYKGYYDRSKAVPWKSAMPERRDRTNEPPPRTVLTTLPDTPAPSYEPKPYVPTASYAPAEPITYTTDDYSSSVGSDYRIQPVSPAAPASMDGFPLTVHQGTYYKVQIIAVETFDIGHSRYDPVRDLASIETEYLEDLSWVRVLLGPVFDYQEAQALKDRVQQYTNFERAFVVKYRDGERVTIIR